MRRASVTVSVMFWLLVAIAARAAQPHVGDHRSPIWCDGIDDYVSDPFWGVAQSKKDDPTLAVHVRIHALRSKPQIAAGPRRASSQDNDLESPQSLLFRPRLFAARAIGAGEFSDPH